VGLVYADGFFNAVGLIRGQLGNAGGGIGRRPGGTPQQFGRFIDAEITNWTKIAKDVGVKAE
jgi:hypothetical protein